MMAAIWTSCFCSIPPRRDKDQAFHCRQDAFAGVMTPSPSSSETPMS